MDFSCKVDSKDLIKELEKLGPKCKPVLRKALRKLANQVKKAMKPLIPKRTGALRKSIKVVPIRSQKFYTVGFRVFPDYPQARDGKKLKFYAFAPEYGVTQGKSPQRAQQFMLRGAQIAEEYVERTKEEILTLITLTWEKASA